MIYKLVKIEDHAILISRGKTPKYGNSNEFRAVKSAQVRIDKIDWEGCQTLSQEFGEKCPLKFILKEDDVLLNGTGTGTLGRPGIVRGMPKGNYVPDSHVNLIRTKESLESKYLFYWLISPTGQRIIDKSYTGSTNQIELASSRVGKFRIPLPPLEEQKKIAAILDAADALRQKDKALIAKYEELTQSLFLDMFGDPVSNSKEWEKLTLKKLGKVTTGNTPSRKITDYYGDYIEWIKTDNINTPNTYLTRAEEFLSETGAKIGRIVPKGSLLVTCIAGSRKVIGNVAITDREVAFNQQINSFTPFSGQELYYYFLFKVGKSHIQSFSTDGMKGMISKSNFEKIDFISPPLLLQNQFVERVQQIEKQKQLAQQSLQKSEELFNSLLQRAFKGELTKTLELA